MQEVTAPVVNGVARQNGTVHRDVFAVPDLGKLQGREYVAGASVLAERVAYSLSSTIFRYDDGLPETESAVGQWSKTAQPNPRRFVPKLEHLQTRSGAGIFVLGHSSTKDPRDKFYPDSVLASSATVGAMQPILTSLPRTYSAYKPVVAHIEAIDTDYNGQFVTDYVTPLRTAREAGLAAIISKSANEIQYVSILASLFSTVLPTLHIYDGVKLSHELSEVNNIIPPNTVKQSFDTVRQLIPTTSKPDPLPQLSNILTVFNSTLNSHFAPFEYHGHGNAQTVLVVLGSQEATLALPAVTYLSEQGIPIGLINVRIYQPFSDSDFLFALPRATTKIAVLGQVETNDRYSILYEDVYATVATKGFQVDVVDIKYTKQQSWLPENFTWICQQLLSGAEEISLEPNPEDLLSAIIPQGIKKYVFWDLDDAVSSIAARKVAQEFVNQESLVSFNETYDNFSQAGLLYSEVLAGFKYMPRSHSAVDVAVLADVSIANSYDVVHRLAPGGKLLIKTTIKQDDLEKKLPTRLRKAISRRAEDIEVYIINPKDSGQIGQDDVAENLVIQLAFPNLINYPIDIEKFAHESSSSSDDLATVIQGLTTINEQIVASLTKLSIPISWTDLEDTSALPTIPTPNSFTPNPEKEPREDEPVLSTWHAAAQQLIFKEPHAFESTLRPEFTAKTWIVRVQENKRLTPLSYDRNIFHIEFDLTGTDLTYAIGEALGIHGHNDEEQVVQFLQWYGLDPEAVISIPAKEFPGKYETRTVRQLFVQQLDIFGKPPKKFYEMLSEFASDEQQKIRLKALGGSEGAVEFKRRSEVETLTFADILEEFPSAKPSLPDLIKLIPAIKRREYSIASSQKVHPTSVHLLVVEVNWKDEKNRDRYGQCTRYLSQLPVGAPVTVSVKPSVMKLPAETTTPIIMAGLGTGLAPFRAFVQERALQRQQGKEIGLVFLYMGSRHQREEYLYGEEWEAYRDSGIITLLGLAFSRDQPKKVYIQDLMRRSLKEVVDAFISKKGCFYLCGPVSHSLRLDLTCRLGLYLMSRGFYKMRLKKKRKLRKGQKWTVGRKSRR